MRGLDSSSGVSCGSKRLSLLQTHDRYLLAEHDPLYGMVNNVKDFEVVSYGRP